MKEKIDLFARGVFSYDRPELSTSVGNINISVEMGKVIKGSFSVASTSEKPFKGIVYSGDSLLKIENPTFKGVENTINYTFDATYLDINDNIKGRISVVSELGELDIPFQVKVKVPSCETSIGPASDLFHFASLAQTDWAEAKLLFKSDEFRRTLSFYDPKFDNLYRALLRSGNVSLALEELLTAAHKKKSVNIKPEKTEISYENTGEIISDSILLTKDTWGYCQLRVETEGDFLNVDRKIVWMDDFDGNNYRLVYSIDPAYLHHGTNLGALIIYSLYEKIEIPVIIKNSGAELKSRLSRRKMRHAEMKLVTGYTDYKLGRVSASKLSSELEKCLDNLKVFRNESTLDRFIRVWLWLETGHEAKAINALGLIFEDEEWGDDVLLYAIALYLKARTEHESMASEIAQRIRDLYENTKDARIFVFCILLDKKNRISSNARFDALRKSDATGRNSVPVLIEACKTVSSDPTVLKCFNGFDLLVVRYAVRNKLLNRNTVLHVADLALREKTTSPLIIDTLIRINETYHVNEVLEALCTHLVKAGDHSEAAFKWLSIGIIEQLSVKNIYESCLLAAGRNTEKALPKAMMSYFEGGMDMLDDNTRAAYYANVLRFRASADSISFALGEQIKEFTLRKLNEGAIDDNLAILYNNVLKSADLSDAQIAILPDIVFKNKVEIDDENAKHVLIAHKELDKELAFEVKDGVAYADIFTEDNDILCEDEHGNRIVPKKINITRMITNSDLIRTCLARCTEDLRVLLNCLENARYRGDSEETISLVKLCVEQENLERRFELECRKELIEYYYENLESELMEDLLVQTELAELSRRDRARMLDLMILRELYSLAMKNMELYGSYGVEVRRMAKLCSRLIESNASCLGTELFTFLCFSVFKKKKHDDQVLEYLVRYYNGDSDSMYELWLTAVEAGIDAGDLEERLLAQILFTENDMSYSKDILLHYYPHGINRRLIRAFLSYSAYKYLVRENLPENVIFELMRRESTYEDNDLCMLALLKYMSQAERFADTDRNFIESKMSMLERRGIIMPFFKNFKAGIHIPEGMQDKQYVEYHTDPRRHVKIHYCLLTGEEDGNYQTEEMKDLGYGIFVSEFVVFYGEVLQYYITEECDEEDVITESGEVRLEPELIGNEDTGYRQLNLIITAREMNDSKTMQRLLETYIRNENIGKRMFNPLF